MRSFFIILLSIFFIGFAVPSAQNEGTTLMTKTKELKRFPLEIDAFKPNAVTTSPAPTEPTTFIDNVTSSFGSTVVLVATAKHTTAADTVTAATLQMEKATIAVYVPVVDVNVQAFGDSDTNEVNKSLILLFVILAILLLCIVATFFYYLAKKLKGSSTYKIPRQSLNKSDLLGKVDVAGPLIPVLDGVVEKNNVIQAIEFDVGPSYGAKKLEVINEDNTDEAVNRLVGDHLVIDARLNDIYEVENGTTTMIKQL